MHVKKHVVSVTTAADGTATAYTDDPLNGPILKIMYAKTDFADTADISITTEATVQNLWVESNVTASKNVCPRDKLNDLIGGDVAFYDPVVAVNERVKIAIAQGGATKTGIFTILGG